MATIGEHLHSVATRADEAMARVEAEPLNVADYIESNEWKSIREYIKTYQPFTQWVSPDVARYIQRHGLYQMS